jgi:hypothetical protein
MQMVAVRGAGAEDCRDHPQVRDRLDEALSGIPITCKWVLAPTIIDRRLQKLASGCAFAFDVLEGTIELIGTNGLSAEVRSGEVKVFPPGFVASMIRAKTSCAIIAGEFK